MSFIHSFRIEGLAGHKRPVERKLDRHVNVFWGLNGTGKTSLLKILHAALSNRVNDLTNVPFEHAEVVLWSDDFEALIRRSFSKAADDEVVYDDEGSLWVKSPDGTWEVADFDSREWRSEFVEEGAPGLAENALQRDDVDARALSTSYRHSYLPISRLSEMNNRVRNSSAPRARVIDEAVLDEHFAEHVYARWQEYNSSALAQIRGIQQQGLAAILAILFGKTVAPDQRASIGESMVGHDVSGEDAYHLVRNFLKEQGINLGVSRSEFLGRYRNETALQEVVASIENTSDKVADATKPQQEFAEIIERLYSGSKSLILGADRFRRRSLRVEIDEHPIPLQSLSSGEKQLLRLMLELLAADENTVMIDEPELSMHVDWQLVLVESMRRVNPGCQLLLATHSPEVMAHVDESYVFQL